MPEGPYFRVADPLPTARLGIYGFSNTKFQKPLKQINKVSLGFTRLNTLLPIKPQSASRFIERGLAYK